MDNTYAGSCHCGAVTFEAQVDLGAVGTCNCSRCRRLGVIWSFAPKEDFTLLSGEEVLTSYRFNKMVIEHLFCSVCGVEVFARRPQVQERLTTQIVDALAEHLNPSGAIVVVECEHMCMSMRGVQKPGAKTVTSAVRGQLRETATRAEAMSLILGR